MESAEPFKHWIDPESVIHRQDTNMKQAGQPCLGSEHPLLLIYLFVTYILFSIICAIGCIIFYTEKEQVIDLPLCIFNEPCATVYLPE